MLRTLVVLTLVLPLIPLAAAHGPCDHGAEDALSVASFHVTSDGHVFEETNTHAGLQRSGGSCETEDGRTANWSADRSVL